MVIEFVVLVAGDVQVMVPETVTGHTLANVASPPNPEEAELDDLIIGQFVTRVKRGGA